MCIVKDDFQSLGSAMRSCIFPLCAKWMKQSFESIRSTVFQGITPTLTVTYCASPQCMKADASGLSVTYVPGSTIPVSIIFEEMPIWQQPRPIARQVHERPLLTLKRSKMTKSTHFCCHSAHN